MSSLGERISSFWSRVNGSLFPALEEADVEMTPKLYQLVTLLDLLQIELFVPSHSPYQVGRKPHDRRCLAQAFWRKPSTMPPIPARSVIAYCTMLYELKDRGYDAKWIRRGAELAGHVPIIDYIKRRGQERARELEPDRAEHYKGRTVVERFNARLKDEFGGDMVRVRGNRKVHAHLMCGLLVILADQLLRLV